MRKFITHLLLICASSCSYFTFGQFINLISYTTAPAINRMVQGKALSCVDIIQINILDEADSYFRQLVFTKMNSTS